MTGLRLASTAPCTDCSGLPRDEPAAAAAGRALPLLLPVCTGAPLAGSSPVMMPHVTPNVRQPEPRNSSQLGDVKCFRSHAALSRATGMPIGMGTGGERGGGSRWAREWQLGGEAGRQGGCAAVTIGKWAWGEGGGGEAGPLSSLLWVPLLPQHIEGC